MSARGSGANESYLDAARRGKQTWWRYLLGIIFILFMWLGVGSAAAFALGAVTGVGLGTIPENPTVTQQILTFLSLGVSFVFFFLGTVLAVAWIHRRNPLTLVTARRSIDWRRVGLGFGVWIALEAVATFVFFLISPSSYSVGPDLLGLIPFALIALILFPIQTTAEELFFRGYVVQGASLISGNVLLLSLTSGIAFMVPHIANPEVGTSFLSSLLYYVAFGAFATLISLKDGTLELAIGIHAANNLFIAILVNYAGGAVSTPSLFQTSESSGWLSLISWLVLAALFYLVVFVFLRRQPASSRNLS